MKFNQVVTGFVLLSMQAAGGSVSAFTPTTSSASRSPAFVQNDINSRRKNTNLNMATSGPMKCRPIGIGSSTPKTVVTNVDLENVVETNDEWIQTRTGIAERHLISNPLTEGEGDDDKEVEKESLASISYEAAKNALDMSGLTADDIDLVICATSSPDDLFGDATTISAKLGCKNAFAFDLTAACSGFLFGIVTAGQFLDRSGKSGTKNAIVIGADALSRWVDWNDRNSCILFGDGAGAMVLTATDDAEDGDDSKDAFGVLGYSAHSNGLGHDDLMCGFKGDPITVATPGEGTPIMNGSYNFISMNGRKVYQFATREVPVVLEEALEAAELKVDDIDWLLLHQANIRIMETVAKRLGVPMEKVITNLSKYGNTSAGSIPLALDEAVRTGKVKKGDIIACAGFGAGLSWGSAIIRWGGEDI